MEPRFNVGDNVRYTFRRPDAAPEECVAPIVYREGSQYVLQTLFGRVTAQEAELSPVHNFKHSIGERVHVRDQDGTVEGSAIIGGEHIYTVRTLRGKLAAFEYELRRSVRYHITRDSHLFDSTRYPPTHDVSGLRVGMVVRLKDRQGLNNRNRIGTVQSLQSTVPIRLAGVVKPYIQVDIGDRAIMPFAEDVLPLKVGDPVKVRPELAPYYKGLVDQPDATLFVISVDGWVTVSYEPGGAVLGTFRPDTLVGATEGAPSLSPRDHDGSVLRPGHRVRVVEGTASGQEARVMRWASQRAGRIWLMSATGTSFDYSSGAVELTWSKTNRGADAACDAFVEGEEVRLLDPVLEDALFLFRGSVGKVVRRAGTVPGYVAVTFDSLWEAQLEPGDLVRAPATGEVRTGTRVLADEGLSWGTEVQVLRAPVGYPWASGPGRTGRVVAVGYEPGFVKVDFQEHGILQIAVENLLDLKATRAMSAVTRTSHSMPGHVALLRDGRAGRISVCKPTDPTKLLWTDLKGDEVEVDPCDVSSIVDSKAAPSPFSTGDDVRIAVPTLAYFLGVGMTVGHVLSLGGTAPGYVSVDFGALGVAEIPYGELERASSVGTTAGLAGPARAEVPCKCCSKPNDVGVAVCWSCGNAP